MATEEWTMQARTILSAVAIVAAAVSMNAGVASAENQTGSVYNNVRYNFGSNTWKMDSKYLPAEINYSSSEKPGTVIISTRKKYLYVVQEGGKAKRFGIGVGRRGFRWRGEEKVSRKAEWPAWHPPAEMREREPHLPERMEGGEDNPLGARALYLGNTLYRIHGTHQPWTIGESVSSGCIRLRNEDVISLYDMVKVGAKVIVD
ncbi:L,D-transpeptidase family protein [Anderseniella sp. Alg231-50]|uniref:L,D-transpeptidase family protein n=1 Tax=Anderseniella sp. Alg231-50 TaxID=1922226 RepID=UPI000D55AFC7